MTTNSLPVQTQVGRLRGDGPPAGNGRHGPGGIWGGPRPGLLPPASLARREGESFLIGDGDELLAGGKVGEGLTQGSRDRIAGKVIPAVEVGIPGGASI